MCEYNSLYGWGRRHRSVCKKVKRNILAILITIIIVELMSYVGFWETEKFKYSCMYMLIYLCINEVLKEN
nr:MAG TPA: hypothetical protein [Caudoviricetes sp.]